MIKHKPYSVMLMLYLSLKLHQLRSLLNLPFYARLFNLVNSNSLIVWMIINSTLFSSQSIYTFNFVNPLFVFNASPIPFPPKAPISFTSHYVALPWPLFAAISVVFQAVLMRFKSVSVVLVFNASPIILAPSSPILLSACNTVFVFNINNNNKKKSLSVCPLTFHIQFF